MRILSAVLFTGSLVVFGCSGGGDTTGKGGNTSTATGTGSYTQKVGAVGGTFTAPGATVVIPAGALAADTTLTLTVSDKAGQPNADTIAASIFDFGPNGTKFLKPVTMTLDFTGTAPSSDVAKIAYLEAGAWVPLTDSAASGGKVTATTTHFTPFTVVWSSGGQVSGGCTALAACCPKLPTVAQPGCNMQVATHNDAACNQTLAGLQAATQCL